MKKILLSTAALSLMAANVAMADATVYGKLNLSLQKIVEDSAGVKTQDNFEVVSNASRLGFKGDTEITAGLKALAKIEYEVAGDGDLYGINADSPFKARNVYVGLEGDSWGQLISGRTDTPLKNLGKKVDIFNDSFVGDIKNLVEGENRASNMIQYQTPKWAGITSTVMVVAGEEAGVTVGDRDSVANGISMAVDYAMDDFSVGLGVDHDIASLDVYRLAANWKIASVTLGALLQSSKMNDSAAPQSDELAAIMSAAWTVSNWTLKAQYGQAKVDTGAANDEDKSLTALGADYKLAKSTKVYAYFAQSEADIVDDKESTVGVGLEHKF